MADSKKNSWKDLLFPRKDDGSPDPVKLARRSMLYDMISEDDTDRDGDYTFSLSDDDDFDDLDDEDDLGDYDEDDLDDLDDLEGFDEDDFDDYDDEDDEDDYNYDDEDEDEDEDDSFEDAFKYFENDFDDV